MGGAGIRPLSGKFNQWHLSWKKVAILKTFLFAYFFKEKTLKQNSVNITEALQSNYLEKSITEIMELICLRSSDINTQTEPG